MSYLDARFTDLELEFGKTKVLLSIRDERGVYAFQIQRPDGKRYYFAAKTSMKGTTVSCHKTLWDMTQSYQTALILAIGRNFYHFYPRNLAAAKHWTNLRDGQYLMMNWDLKEACGRNLKELGKPESPTPQPKPAEPELFDGKETE